MPYSGDRKTEYIFGVKGKNRAKRKEKKKDKKENRKEKKGKLRKRRVSSIGHEPIDRFSLSPPSNLTFFQNVNKDPLFFGQTTIQVRLPQSH